MRRIHRDLMGYLVDVTVSVVGEEFQIYRLSIVQRQHVFVPQDFRRLVYGMIVQMNHDAVPFSITESRRPLCLRQFFRVERSKLRPGIGYDIIVILQIQVPVADGFKTFDEFYFYFIF